MIKMLYNRCMGIYKFGNNTYPRRIRRRSNLDHIFQGKNSVLWAGKYGILCINFRSTHKLMAWVKCSLVLATVNTTREGFIWLQKLGTFELHSTIIFQHLMQTL